MNIVDIRELPTIKWYDPRKYCGMQAINGELALGAFVGKKILVGGSVCKASDGDVSVTTNNYLIFNTTFKSTVVTSGGFLRPSVSFMPVEFIPTNTNDVLKVIGADGAYIWVTWDGDVKNVLDISNPNYSGSDAVGHIYGCFYFVGSTPTVVYEWDYGQVLLASWRFKGTLSYETTGYICFCDVQYSKDGTNWKTSNAFSTTSNVPVPWSISFYDEARYFRFRIWASSASFRTLYRLHKIQAFA
jgi:hypothetical protein